MVTTETYLNQTGVDEDSRRDSVEDTADDTSGGATGVVRRADAQTDSDTYGCGDTVKDRTEERDPVVFGRERHVSKTGADTKTLKRF